MTLPPQNFALSWRDISLLCGVRVSTYIYYYSFIDFSCQIHLVDHPEKLTGMPSPKILPRSTTPPSTRSLMTHRCAEVPSLKMKKLLQLAEYLLELSSQNPPLEFTRVESPIKVALDNLREEEEEKARKKAEGEDVHDEDEDEGEGEGDAEGEGEGDAEVEVEGEGDDQVRLRSVNTVLMSL